jgi:hypothetical protein
VHLIIDATCPLVVGEMPLRGKDKVMLELRITKKRFDTRENLATVKLEMFTPYN